MERFARLFVAPALIGALAACANNAGSTSSSSSPAASTEASAAAAAPAASTSAGARVYNQDCSSCHQPNGQGLKGSFPPLVGNPTVTGYDIHVIHIVKYGLSGPIKVDNVQYNGMMPAWSQQLSNADIASVLTYIRSSWGNRARPISESRVAAVNKSME